jgi:hypothetical protein
MNIKLFSPHKGQKQIINDFADSQHKFGVVATGRQFGKSLLAQNLMLYWLLLNPKQKGAWITPVYNQCKKIFDELTNAAHSIIVKQNKADLLIHFTNGSTLQFLSTDNYNNIRGFSFHYMVVDEAAFIKEEAINEAVLPTLTALGKKCLIISTPKSKNWFYNWYIRGLEANNTYISFRGVSEDNPYVDKEFILEQYKSLPTEIYKQEYKAEFTEAGNDVFKGINDVCILNGFEEPSRGKRYYAGIDLGLSNDYSVLSILDESGRMVYIERINGTSYEDIAKVFTYHLKRYNITDGYCEVNGPGTPVFEVLHNQVRKLRPFTTTSQTKTEGIRTLIYDIQTQELMLPSKDIFPALYSELSVYTYKLGANGQLSFTHPNGQHDDCVMSLMLANEARKKGFTKSKIYIGQNNKQKQYNYGI